LVNYYDYYQDYTECTVSKTSQKIEDTLFVLVTIKEIEMGEGCSTHVAFERDITKTSIEELEAEDAT